jgi:ADP-ribosylglycohydrolase
MSTVKKLIETDVPPDKAADRIGRTVTVQESMPFAVYSFLRFPESMEDCLSCAILNGGDRDTLGAMACSISGAYLGVDSIPSSWLKKLENRVMLEEMAYSLAERPPAAS